jgi:hypothetical protein
MKNLHGTELQFKLGRPSAQTIKVGAPNSVLDL